MEGDLASQMVEGIDRFLLKQTEEALAGGLGGGGSSREEYEQSRVPHREQLAHMLGVRDPRPSKVTMELLATIDRPALVAASDAFEVYAVRWNAFGDVHGEGLLLKPLGRTPIADIVALPDADVTPETIAGLVDAAPPEVQYARRLAESGCRVIVPVLMDRTPRKRLAPGRTTGPELSNREFLYRAAYELGRHVIGYEVQKVLAAIDWFASDAKARPVGVVGWGEGGMLAFYAAALDPRITAACVSGYYGRRGGLWREPIDRNVFGLLQHFHGDANIASLILPRGLVIETAAGPRLVVKGKGAAPGELGDPVDPAGENEQWFNSTPDVTFPMKRPFPRLVENTGTAIGEPALSEFLTLVSDARRKVAPLRPSPRVTVLTDTATRQTRQFDDLDHHTQALLAKSTDVRRDYFAKRLDTSSPVRYELTSQEYRYELYNDILGRFRKKLIPPNPRTRKLYDTDKYTGYEVVLDVFPDVFAYGVLLLPKDLKEGERRPVVVCQHGLEGRPRDTIEGNNPYYHAFAAKLAEQGFITFAPQNPYIFGERFRTLYRKAYPLGKTLWSIIIPQHQQILTFLKSQPNVDPNRIAFYGLSYGGKTAMRVPAVLTDYCLSICSGDFNEWIQKCSSTILPMSYVFTNEYDMCEFDLGQTFNYAEMAALIAPRPFMVERGHWDTVSTDEWVAFEFAKVRRLYQGQLKLPADRCQIEFFDGPHTIHGVGTFEFLQKHLNWEKPR
jgi:dienelactone hydrolase